MPDPGDLATPWALRVAVTLRIAERLEHGAMHIDRLAADTRCDPESLARVLRHLVQQGFFEEPAPGEFHLNDASHQLTSAEARFGLDLEGIGGRMSYVWSTLLEAVRSGRPHYDSVFEKPFWEDLDAHPTVAASFDALMGPGHGPQDPAVLLDSDWSGVRTVVDVGGGTGSLLTAIVDAHPSVNGVLVDLPRTVARSEAHERITVVGQSFFEPLPSGGDLYLLKNLLADWPDADAERLLQRCAEAARPNGRVIVLGGVSPGTNAAPELLMLVLVGGKARSLDEFRSLAARAGLEVVKSGALPSGRFAVECRPTR
jgi:hypothetical protein